MVSVALSPDIAIQLQFFQAGKGEFTQPEIHRKTMPFCIIAQVVEGAYELITPKAEVRIEAGEAFISSARTPLEIHHVLDGATGYMRYRFIHLQVLVLDAIDFLATLQLPAKIDAQTGAKLNPYFKELLKKNEKDAPEPVNPWADMVARQAVAFQIVHFLIEVSKPTHQAGHVMQATQQLTPVLREIKHQLHEDIDILWLCKCAQMSRTSLYEVFSKQLGVSPMEYVKRVRLQKAYHLLSFSEQSITEVSEQVGFANPYHFSREFKRSFGHSPKHFQQLIRNWQSWL